jgi:hypothetical protein
MCGISWFLWSAKTDARPRDRIYCGYLVRENPWLQLQGRQHVPALALNLQAYRQARQRVRCALIATNSAWQRNEAMGQEETKKAAS